MHHRRIFAAGNSYACGESIGRRWRNSIITILKSNENAALSKDGMTLHDWLPHARGLLPFIQEYAPNTMEEMKGMAAGSDITLDNILLFQNPGQHDFSSKIRLYGDCLWQRLRNALPDLFILKIGFQNESEKI